jgi:hypothetical protein
MSIIHVNQLKARLKELFTGQIDLSDCKDKSAEDIESIFLSRSLAAYTAHHLIGMKPSVAGTTIVDGYNDNGIDAIAFDESQSKLLIVQSKWSKEGKGEPDNGSVKKFVSGIRDLLSMNFDRFNTKVQSRVDEIEGILSSPTTKIVAILDTQAQRSFLFIRNGTLMIFKMRLMMQEKFLKSKCWIKPSYTNH